LLDEILDKAGLKYDDLTSVEKETLNTWVEALQKGQLSLESIKEYITSMREAVEQELTKVNLDADTDLFLKARLRNYMLLDAYLTSPQKAKEHIENAISSMVGKKGE